jgi:beta-ureidopropionase / N-carbamoyl-L-amino-acid hydrolase
MPRSQSNRLSINGERMWATLHDLAKIGGTEKGGVRRLALSALDREGRQRFIDWCRELGCEIEVDGIGNVFAVLRGEDPSLPSVMVGSHLDTQPTGGKYDGAYGVMCALEIARGIRDRGDVPLRTLEIVAWANEEGARFSPPMMGSSVFVGNLKLEDVLAFKDVDGVSIGSELSNDALVARAKGRGPRGIAAYFEAHIEQGPVLEIEDKPIGIVTGAQAQRWYDVSIVGTEAHAGPTPMDHRKDALMGAAELALAVEAVARRQSPDGRATVGTLTIGHPSRNVIPGAVTLTVDLRHPNDDVLGDMDASFRKAAREIAVARGLRIDVGDFWRKPHVPFSEPLMKSLEAIAGDRGFATRRITSGAGHDAVNLAASGVPTCMVFVPTKDGLSHNELESIKQDDAVTGCDVLNAAVLDALNARR